MHLIFSQQTFTHFSLRLQYQRGCSQTMWTPKSEELAYFAPEGPLNEQLVALGIR